MTFVSLASIPAFISGFNIFPEIIAVFLTFLILMYGIRAISFAASLVEEETAKEEKEETQKKKKRKQKYRRGWLQFLEDFNEFKIESFIIVFVAIFLTVMINMTFRDACFFYGTKSPFALNISFRGNYMSYTTNFIRMIAGYEPQCLFGICKVFASLTSTPHKSVIFFKKRCL